MRYILCNEKGFKRSYTGGSYRNSYINCREQQVRLYKNKNPSISIWKHAEDKPSSEDLKFYMLAKWVYNNLLEGKFQINRAKNNVNLNSKAEFHGTSIARKQVKTLTLFSCNHWNYESNKKNNIDAHTGTLRYIWK